MSRRLLRVAVPVAGVVLCVTAQWFADDAPLWTRVALFCLSAACGGLTGRGVALNRTETRYGQHRKAEAGARDSGPLTGLTVDALNHTFGARSWRNARPGRRHVDPGPFGLGLDLVERPPKPELERVESDLPILAHRVARLRFDGTGRPFGPLHYGVPFGVDADAECRERRSTWDLREYDVEPHLAPSLGCRCGFYALPSDVEPWDEGIHYVTLLVELSGTVIEHERGYRAQHQRVVECQIPACPYCERRAEVVLVFEGRMVSSACRAHVPPTLPEGWVVVSIEDVVDLVAVPVTLRGRS